MKIGFTGSRKGINDRQVKTIIDFLKTCKVTCVHHGDCIGADEAFHQIAVKLNLSISVHPPESRQLRAGCSPTGTGELFPEKPFLDRNQDIVDACDLLIACPETANEKLRSGTWATVRYARKQEVNVELIPMKEPETKTVPKIPTGEK